MHPLSLRLSNKEGKSQFIVIVSKKIDKRAVARNRIRRLIREVLRRTLPGGFVITCIVKQNIAEYSYKEVKTIIKNLLHEKNIS